MSKSKERKESFSECAENKCTTNLNDEGALSIYCDICSELYCIKCMGIQKKNFEVISSSRHIKMACTKCLKFSFTMLCKDQSKLEHDEIREKLSKMEKTMNHFEEIGAKIEEKVDEAISKKLESLELIQSITKKLEKLPAELQNKIETIPKHIDNSYSKVLQRNMEEHKEEKIIKSVGDIVEEAMNKNKKEDEIKRSVIIHKLEETHMNNFDDRMKADMNKLSELLEEGVKIQMPEITKIHRIGKYNPDNNGKYRQKSKLCSKIILQEIKCLEMHQI